MFTEETKKLLLGQINNTDPLHENESFSQNFISDYNRKIDTAIKETFQKRFSRQFPNNEICNFSSDFYNGNITIYKYRGQPFCEISSSFKVSEDELKFTREIKAKPIFKTSYLSMPITGYSLMEREIYAERLRKELSKIDNNCLVITPFNVCNEKGKLYSYYMGKDIEALLGCNEIILAPGWEDSKGCRAEKAVADIYGIAVQEIESFNINDGIIQWKRKEE